MTTGMELIQAIREGRQQPPTGIATLKLDKGPEWIRTVEPGAASMVWPVSDEYKNLEGAVICSWLACLADQCMFYATAPLLDGDEINRVVDLNMKYLRNVYDGEVRISAKVLSHEDNMLQTEARLTDAEGNLLVLANTTSKISRGQK